MPSADGIVLAFAGIPDVVCGGNDVDVHDDAVACGETKS